MEPYRKDFSTALPTVTPLEMTKLTGDHLRYIKRRVLTKLNPTIFIEPDGVTKSDGNFL